LAKQFSAFKSNKRKKELLRKKKQEEKRKRRFTKKDDPQEDTELDGSDQQDDNLQDAGKSDSADSTED